MANSRRGLLSYQNYDNDDDYHLPSKTVEKTASQRYDELTQKLKTGNREYGLYYPDSPRTDNNLKANSVDFLTGMAKERRAGVSKGETKPETPNYGRRRLITGPQTNDTGKQNGLLEHTDGEDSLFGSKTQGRGRNGPSRPTPRRNTDDDYYRDMQAAYLSTKMADTLKLSDISQIDLVLTLNDKTKVVVKAAPFKPYQF